MMTNTYKWISGGDVMLTDMDAAFSNMQSNSTSYTDRIVARMMKMAEVIEKTDFIGIQIDTSGNGYKTSLFADADTDLSAEDFNWIAGGVSSISPARSGSLENLMSEGRKVYALHQAHQKEAVEDIDSKQAGESFFEMIGIAKENNAVFRFAAGTSEINDGKRAYAILISLPEAMPLRMRALAEMAMPGHTVSEITDTKEVSSKLCSVNAFSTSLEKLLFKIRDDKDRDEFEELVKNVNDVLPNEDDYYPDDFSYSSKLDDIDIDQLKIEYRLSVRTRNCLKRASVNTIGELRQLSYEDLTKIRNMGRKSIREIKKFFERIEELEPEDVISISTVEEEKEETDYMAQLEGLIGLDEAKTQVKKIAALARMQKDMQSVMDTAPSVVLNMEFVGNPGTAKTTVARLMAGILYQTGILKSADIIEIGRADLVAEYVGQTAEKVKTVFRKGRGKLIFIDEAYSLVDSHKYSFGDEAINTIVQEMENHRKETVVVFAGYPDKMEEFFSRNPGLKSRVPFTISFSDYSADEMVQIADLEAENRGFGIDPAAKSQVMKICKTAVGNPDKGNGRFCRNLIEDAILNYAERVYGIDAMPIDRDYTLIASDFDTSSCAEKPEQRTIKKNRIGFIV